ncbi:hypothetical protein RZS08_45280, partial [Arthrospira platensis SPKY1]|nr:hypothetical protein [Arthrospira platensis SPKY1]
MLPERLVATHPTGLHRIPAIALVAAVPGRKAQGDAAVVHAGLQPHAAEEVGAGGHQEGHHHQQAIGQGMVAEGDALHQLAPEGHGEQAVQAQEEQAEPPLVE